MSWFGLVVGVAILAGVVVLWYKLHKNMRGETFELFPARSREKEKGESLEAFVAAYRRGEASPASGTPAPQTNGTDNPAIPAVAPAALPVKREPFLAGGAKLAYYVCKAGLRDHHLFAHVRLASLGTSPPDDPAIAQMEVDLVVCNPEMSIVAAIDVLTGTAGAAPEKADYLRTLGIRYLRLNANALPKPAEIQALIYRM